MRPAISRLLPRGPSLLAAGVLLGLGFPALAESARPLMPFTIFLIVLGTLLRIDPAAIKSALRRPALSVLLPAVVMVAAPMAIGVIGRLCGLGGDIALALVLAMSAPPSSGTAAVARMLGLDGAVPLVVTFLSMTLTPLTVPLLAGWFGGLDVSPLVLALRLAILIGGAEGVALALRRYAAPTLASHGGVVDTAVVASLLVFALATMAGVRAQMSDDPGAAGLCLALAFLCNFGSQIAGVFLLPGTLRERMTVGLILGNRNVGLVWSALGAAATPKMALYFATAQLPIYMAPRLIEFVIHRASADDRVRIASPPEAPR